MLYYVATDTIYILNLHIMSYMFVVAYIDSIHWRLHPSCLAAMQNANGSLRLLLCIFYDGAKPYDAYAVEIFIPVLYFLSFIDNTAFFVRQRTRNGVYFQTIVMHNCKPT